jgi:AraC family transcriptional regulator, arabinose operon regulatory protein
VDPRVRKILDLLKANPHRKFKLSELAREVNISPWHLTRLFFTDVRVSPSRFSRQLKFQSAKVLLENTFLSIKEIMAAVGVNDKSHFAKDFKRLFGIGPSEYRRRHSKQ